MLLHDLLERNLPITPRFLDIIPPHPILAPKLPPKHPLNDQLLSRPHPHLSALFIRLRPFALLISLPKSPISSLLHTLPISLPTSTLPLPRRNTPQRPNQPPQNPHHPPNPQPKDRAEGIPLIEARLQRQLLRGRDPVPVAGGGVRCAQAGDFGPFDLWGMGGGGWVVVIG